MYNGYGIRVHCPLDKAFHRVSTKVQNYHDLIEWIIIGLEMINKALRLREFLLSCGFDNNTLALVPSCRGWGCLEEIHGHLNAFKAVSK